MLISLVDAQMGVAILPLSAVKHLNDTKSAQMVQSCHCEAKVWMYGYASFQVVDLNDRVVSVEAVSRSSAISRHYGVARVAAR